MNLTLTAVRRHDPEAVRNLLSQLAAAADDDDSRNVGGIACAAWLAWQDSQPEEVIRLAGEIAGINLTALDSGAMCGWVGLFPLIAVHLRPGELAEAVSAARQIIDPSQQLLPADLTAALAGAVDSWDEGDQTRTARRLEEALALARTHAYA